MNLQSWLILILLLGAAVAGLVFARKGRKHSCCGDCSGCKGCKH